MDHIKRPVYQKPGDDDFYARLQREVKETVLFDKTPQRAGIAKCVLLTTLYFGSYAGILFFGNDTRLLFAFYILTGLSMIVLFINSFHDAVHGSLFEKPSQNRAFASILELFGSSSWLWQKRHMQLHHPFPNVQHWDIDIKQSDIIRIFPESPVLRFHKYQHLYMWLIYPFYSLNWLYIRDFRDFFSTTDNYLRRLGEIPKREALKMIVAKLLNLFFLLLAPMILLSQPWQYVLAGWLLMHISASSLGVIALISTHVAEDSHFPLTAPDGKLPVTWAAHQMQVTKDFSPDSRIANFLFGGFTHHVAHHLFPGVAHTYYPKITPIIRRYAKEYGLPYHAYPFHEAVLSHFRLLRNAGQNQNLMQSGEI